MIYVDELFDATVYRNPAWKWKKACHLLTDGDEAELKAFARRLGLKDSWLVHRKIFPYFHYDLTPTKRLRAIALGAKEIKIAEFLRRYDPNLKNKVAANPEGPANN